MDEPTAQDIIRDLYPKGLSVAEIAKKAGIAKGSVYVFASRMGLKRRDDVADGAHRFANASLAESVAKKLPTEPLSRQESRYEVETMHSPMDGVAAGIAGKALVRHRRLLRGIRHVGDLMVAELTGATKESREMEGALEGFYEWMMLEQPGRAKELQDTLKRALKAISLPSRSSTLVNLANAMSKVIEREREAYRIKDDEGSNDYETALMALLGGDDGLRDSGVTGGDGGRAVLDVAARRVESQAAPAGSGGGPKEWPLSD